ncbi:unnamed protein product [Thlaspi arvense]|uniref:Pseudouridine synthase I TruA alpha/beta domain-containing protein n=1 Tax=Thlaspi arvense TaxID=13288 RepID=A0AAU9R9V5_THLAR|nr:unnamed protein product [Thlaspi arvense]
MENQEPKIDKLPQDEVPDREPDQKKLKISAAGDEANSSAAAAGGGSGGSERRPPKYRRRKVAIVFAFCGVGYQGMQKNPGAKTIEGELEEALFHAGAVPEADRNKPRQYEWARSARTDKGVSAVGQVVSGRFYVDPPGFVDRLNSNLPDQIRVFGYKRVAPSFSSKKFCDRRRYVYLIPVFALDPCSHSEAEMVRTDSAYEYVSCVECSEKGYKIPLGVMGKDTSDDVKPSELQSDISSSNCDAVKCETLSSNVPNGEDNLTDGADASACVKVDENTDSISKTEDVQEEGCESNLESLKESDTLAKGELGNGGSKFCYGEKEKERFNRILSNYVGSHNFHNFTTRTKAADPAANRYILSFNADTVIHLDGKDFVKCEVVGQSFMLHQIRKMIGLAVAVMRNFAPESVIQTAFKKDVRIVVPMAPEVGLYLDECFFTSYNKRFKGSHDEVSMEEYKEIAEEFKWKHVYSHIGSAEEKDGIVAIWLHSLNRRNYPDLRVAEYKPNEVIVYKKIGEAAEENIHEDKISEKENTNGAGEVSVADKVNDETSEEKSTEANATGTIHGAAWDEDSQILSGRLEPDGGTWFGISRSGRVAFLVDKMIFTDTTNCTSLPMDFLQLDDMSPEDFARHMAQGNIVNDQMAYHLIVADITSNSMFLISKPHERMPVVTAAVGFDVHVLSLGGLDANFSKNLRMHDFFDEMIGDYENQELPPLKDIAALFMYDPEEATEGDKLSAFFVDVNVRNVIHPEIYREERRYRTTSTTALTVKPTNEVKLYERYLEDGVWKEHDFTFNIA